MSEDLKKDIMRAAAQSGSKAKPVSTKPVFTEPRKHVFCHTDGKLQESLKTKKKPKKSNP